MSANERSFKLLSDALWVTACVGAKEGYDLSEVACGAAPRKAGVHVAAKASQVNPLRAYEILDRVVTAASVVFDKKLVKKVVDTVVGKDGEDLFIADLYAKAEDLIQDAAKRSGLTADEFVDLILDENTSGPAYDKVLDNYEEYEPKLAKGYREAEKLERYKPAFVRLHACVENATTWSRDLLVNNLGKAAADLGTKMPAIF